MSINLSPNFTIDEATITSVRRLNNYPPPTLLPVMALTAANLERVRTLLGQPILVTSWYRSPAVNAAVGGSKNSQHMKGQAVDFICPKFGTVFEVARLLESKKFELRFDQLIYEHTWIHISFPIPNTAPRLECLTLEPNGSYCEGIKFKGGKK